MDQQKIVKIFGVFVFITMAISLFAYVGYVALSDPIVPREENDFVTPNETTFNYTVSFDANAIKDLTSMRVALSTTIDEKTLLDSSLKKIDGVMSLASVFQKTDLDSNEWIYLVELTLKKNKPIEEVLESIYLIDYFSDETKVFAMKHMTITVPKEVILHNTSLGIDKNYSFNTTTLSTLTQLDTLPGDELVVEGQVTLRGNILASIELVELENKSAQERFVKEYESIIDWDSIVVGGEGEGVEGESDFGGVNGGENEEIEEGYGGEDSGEGS